MTMTNITKILSNLRRKQIDSNNALECPECGCEVDLDYLGDDITDGEFGFFWEHEVEEVNTSGEKVMIKKILQHPRNEYHVPKYMEIYTSCRHRDSDGCEDCWKSFTVRYYIAAQEIID